MKHDASSGITDRRYERRLMGVWEHFVHGDGLAPGVVRDVVEQSWLRCRHARLDPALGHAPDPLAESELTALRQRHRDLIETSRPILMQARVLLADSGTMMILTDPEGVILQTEGDPATLEAAQDVRLTLGASWNELRSGTNAIGAALSLGAPVQVHGAEHFCAGIKPWTCSAMTVRDPHSGELLGVVDISGRRETFNPHWLALAVSWAGRIEERLNARELELRHRLLDWGLAHLSRVASGGLLFFDRQGRLAAADARARDSLARMGLDPDLGALGRIDSFRTDSPLDLSDAPLPEWLHAEWLEPVVMHGERLGVIVVLPRPSVATVQSGPAVGDSFAVASIAHEVKQPLAAVLANASASLRWLEHEPPNLPEAREALQRIVQEGRRAGDIVGSVRNMMKKSPPRRESVDVNATILGLVALIRGEAQREHVTIETRLSQHLPTVLADRVQVQQVLLNLIRNALESLSSAVGPRNLSIGSHAAESSEVVVDVKDTGTGFDAATAPHLFDPFYTTKPGGMGIGLAISRSIIEAHGGRLWAMQNSPRGAVFLFSLPVR
jgi:signal transduction histidine kinase